MSDDLVKRLRDTPNWKREEYGDYKSAWAHYDRAPFEAANRIEELEKQNASLEAKLAKAVESLAVMDALDPEWFVNACSNSVLKGIVLRMGEIAHTTIAELKGEQP
jgi:hypothetical protein